MSIFAMTGAELASEIGRPAPVAVIEVPRLASVLEQIAALGEADQAALLAAFKVATKPAARISGGKSYRDAESFFVDFNAAREACAARWGREWYLNPKASLKARVPGVWVALKGEMGTWRSPRDVNCPRAEYWPGGVLPIGPEYAEHARLATNDVLAAARWGKALELVPPPEVLELREAA